MQGRGTVLPGAIGLAGRAAMAVAATMAGAGDPALAAGFALKEQSPTAQGGSFAGATAGAEGPSAMFFNPAALAYQPGFSLEAAASAIFPRIRLKDSAGSTVLGTPIPGRSRVGDVGEDAVVPVLHGSVELHPTLVIGLGVDMPFGLRTNYPDGWTGRYHGIDSELHTVNINPAFAWRALPWLSLGGGVQVQRIEGRLTSAIDFGTLGAVGRVPGARPGSQDGTTRVDGDDWAWGWNLGVLVETPVPGLRLGAAYRSQIEQELEGDAEFGLGGPVGSAVADATGAFHDTNAKLNLTTPDSASVGFHYQFDPAWAVMGEVQWTGWSDIQEVRVEFDNPRQPDSVIEQKWNDTWFLALGGTWQPSDRWKLRTGFAFDQSPTTDRWRSPRIPDGDRYWLSLGASFKAAAWLSFDAAYTHIFVRDTEVDLPAAGADAPRGSLEAAYESEVDILALSARLVF